MSFKNVKINEEMNFLVRLNWTEMNIGEIVVFDYENLKIWKGEVLDEQNQAMASTLTLTLLDYKAEIEGALQPSSSSHTCTILNNSFTVKKIASNGMSIRICVIPVKEVSLTDHLPGIMKDITKKANEFEEEKIIKDKQIECLKQERGELMVRCESYAKIVENLSSHLFGQFSVAFNTLKRKLEPNDDGNIATTSKCGTSVEQVSSHKNSKSQKRPRFSERVPENYDEDTDVDTEDERQ